MGIIAMGKFISGITATSFKSGIMLAFCLGLYSASAAAQMFAPVGNSGNLVPSSATDGQARQAVVPNVKIQGSGVQSNKNIGNPTDYRYRNRTYDIGNINQKPQEPQKPQIFIYMRDFKVSRILNGSINCSMRFYVYTTLKEKITNLSCRLKWPDMETVLVFDDVEPDTRTYFDYSLLGEGCYSMDKAPNIIVNRCRVKGMTQQQCAQSIRWAK